MAEFAQALLVIPKTLAVNAAQDATDLVAKLRAFHNASQTMMEREGLKWYNNQIKWIDLLYIYRYGLDLISGTVRDNKKAGVLEPAMSKIKSLKFAAEAAITILRIDDMIKISPQPKDHDGMH